MKEIALTIEQARRFLLRHHGLIGEHRFAGKAGALAYVRQCGCVQFDPIDVCGRNADLTMQSRVKGYRKPMLDALLYDDRALFDYFDKNLAILPIEDWPCFEREREANRLNTRSRDEVEQAAETVRAALAEKACVSSRELGMDEKVGWYWSPTTLSRAVLETLYFRGELCVHHKQGTTKYYAPVERLLPETLLSAPDPYPDDAEHVAWRTYRRIGAVGLLWNRRSDAYLCIGGYGAYNTGTREAAYARLIEQDQLIRVSVGGIAEPLYARDVDAPLLNEVASGAAYAPRVELIAPLDCLLWDRRLIEALFGFSYTWEIYTPQAKRRYGYYVLPLLCGERFAGRVEAVADRKAKALRVKGVWWEGRPQPAKLRACLNRFARFNECDSVEILETATQGGP